ncbi:hypothetical protein [Wielerella bovis]|nr:hypothetical protein [Wielerella bovis]
MRTNFIGKLNCWCDLVCTAHPMETDFLGFRLPKNENKTMD